jgi:hypothetical protein
VGKIFDNRVPVRNDKICRVSKEICVHFFFFFFYGEGGGRKRLR